jgi:hypothetical protein
VRFCPLLDDLTIYNWFQSFYSQKGLTSSTLGVICLFQDGEGFPLWKFLPISNKMTETCVSLALATPFCKQHETHWANYYQR